MLFQSSTHVYCISMPFCSSNSADRLKLFTLIRFVVVSIDIPAAVKTNIFPLHGMFTSHKIPIIKTRVCNSREIYPKN